MGAQKNAKMQQKRVKNLKNTDKLTNFSTKKCQKCNENVSKTKWVVKTGG